MATLKIEFDIPDAVVPRALNSFAKCYGYRQAIINPESLEAYTARTGGAEGYQDTIPNPQNKLEFLKQKVREMIKSAIRKQEISDAQELARSTTWNDVEKNIVLTDPRL